MAHTENRQTVGGKWKKGVLCANRAGAIVLLMTVSQYGLTSLLMALLRGAGLDISARFWGLSAPLYLCIYLMLYILMMGVPLAVGTRFFSPKETARKRAFSSKRRVSVILLGVALCLLGDMLAAVLTEYLYMLGIAEPQLPVMNDGSFLTLLLNLLVLAAVPAVMEECLMRGLVLQTLRPLGDGLAVTVSALLFALMHGNVRQAPYALLMGLVLGWVYVYTGSLRAAIAVHGISNALVLIVSYSLQFQDSGRAMQLQMSVLAAVLLFGIAGAVWLSRHRLRRSQSDSPAPASLRVRIGALFRAPILLVSAAVMAVLLIVYM